MANRWGNSDGLYFLGAPKSLQMVTAAMKLKDACSLEKSYDKPRQWIKGAFNFMAAVLVRSNLSTKVHRVKVVEALVFSVGM